MPDFDLISVDWETVRLMHADQLRHDTHYLEELVRWILQRGQFYGLLRMEDDAVPQPSPEGDRMFTVTVRGCIAVTEHGRIIDIPERPDMPLSAKIEAVNTLVPIYIGAALTPGKVPQLKPATESGLLGCGGLHREYAISGDAARNDYDWVQIAQFTKTPAGLRPDPEYIPECLFLSSHPLLWSVQEELRTLAVQALDTLVEHSSSNPGRFAAAVALAGSLGPAAQPSNGLDSPRAYVTRLGGVFAAHRSQLLALPKPDKKIHHEAVQQLAETHEYLSSGNWTLGRALSMARECFHLLIALYPELLKFLDTVGQAPERRYIESETFVPGTPPPDMGQAERKSPRPGGFMRRK